MCQPAICRLLLGIVSRAVVPQSISVNKFVQLEAVTVALNEGGDPVDADVYANITMLGRGFRDGMLY